MDPARERLSKIVSKSSPAKVEVAARKFAFREQLLRSGKLIDRPNFTRLHPHTLETAFDIYDEQVFAGTCRSLLRSGKSPIEFKFSRRMTRTGGVTERHETYDRWGQITSTRFVIKLSATLLFQSFRDGRGLRVSGCRCSDRLEAMLRIVEHEMIHLIEMLLWRDSSCSKRRFQGIANRLFEHTESTHQLLTPIEIARDQFGIRPGDQVTFAFEGRRLRGLVNRITRRATVLVKDATGEKYSDGQRYRKFYVPLKSLQRIGK